MPSSSINIFLILPPICFGIRIDSDNITESADLKTAMHFYKSISFLKKKRKKKRTNNTIIFKDQETGIWKIPCAITRDKGEKLGDFTWYMISTVDPLFR